MLLALDVHRIIRVKCLFCVGRFSGFMLNGFLEGFPRQFIFNARLI